MLETKYGMKYSMPHSVVHIVDNSMYTGQLPTIVTDDPSLYATIVVSGAPMGADNEMIPINRSDILNVAYGMASLSSGDIKKYGQSVTYPNAILSQDAPIKFMRVTPDGSTYAFSCLLIQWRWDGSTMHVRFKTTSGNGNNGLPLGIVHSSFKNTDRLNSALVRGFADDNKEEADGVWKQRVFMTAIGAGRGKIYDNFNYAINPTSQSRRPPNVKYMFATLDTRSDQTVERFYASLVNQNNGNRPDAIETANVQVGQREKGSSIIKPYINEEAVQELYNEYMAKVKEMMDADILPSNSDSMKWVKDVYVTMNVNIFDPIYGRYIYNGDSDVKLPYFQVDMFDLDIPQLDTANRIKVFLGTDESAAEYIEKPDALNAYLDSKTYGVSNPDNPYHVGDLFVTNTATMALTLITTINQYTGAITSIPISQVKTGEMDGTKPILDMFRAYVSTEGKTLEKVTAQVTDLINRGKLAPRKKTTRKDGDVTYIVYQPDFILVENKVSVDPVNKLNNFFIAKIAYNDKDASTTGTPTIDSANSVVYTTKKEIYPILAYPSSKITSFATAETDEFYKTPGTTYININTTDTTNCGKVYVNGYKGVEDRTEVVTQTNTPFYVGICPTSFAVTKPIVGTSYDLMLYQDSDDSSSETSFDVTWKINGGTSTDTASAPKSTGPYAVNDIVALAAYPGTLFKVTAVTPIPDTEDKKDMKNVEVAFESSDASSTKIVPNEYATAPYDKYIHVEIVNTETDPEATPKYDPEFAVNTFYSRSKAYSEGITIKNTGTQQDPVYVPAFEENRYYTRTGTDTAGDPYVYTLVTSATGWGTSITTVYTENGYEYNLITNDTGWGTTVTDVYTKGTASGLTIKITESDIDVEINPANADPTMIKRYTIAGTQGSIYRYGMDPTEIPANYYSQNYGVNPNTEMGGIPIENGYAGFFDDDISDIEFKWRYSELLVQAYKGEKDPRINSTTRCPAKYLFDGGTNTIVGQTILPYMVYKPIDIINASTIYTDDEKEAILLNNDLISNIKDFTDIDVKQAMYDLMIRRCYQGIPEDKRPIGPGSGLSLHLDSGVTDANTAMLINQTFSKKFSNPNASWDIGGYVSSADGIAYTYTKALVDNMFGHMKRFTVNKPFTGKYTNISPDQYISFFPDIDTTDWEERELLYNSGGNAWIMDVNGNLQRKSQRTLYREGDTSDLIQENNMRTLSQLVYLLQNKIDSYLLEYNDDGVLKTLKDDVDNLFTNWVGNLVQALDITFQRDINPLDGGEIVVCYCNVTFRGLILRVPIIVNVQRRTDSE